MKRILALALVCLCTLSIGLALGGVLAQTDTRPDTQPVIRVRVQGVLQDGLAGAVCWPRPDNSPLCSFDDPEPTDAIPVPVDESITFVIDPDVPTPQIFIATAQFGGSPDTPQQEFNLLDSNGELKTNSLPVGPHPFTVIAAYPGEDANTEYYVSYVFLLDFQAPGTSVAVNPTLAPTEAVTVEPTAATTEAPSETPTEVVTETPTEVSTAEPTAETGLIPTATPRAAVTQVATEQPTEAQSATPTLESIIIGGATETPVGTDAATEAPTQQASNTPAPRNSPTPTADIMQQTLESILATNTAVIESMTQTAGAVMVTVPATPTLEPTFTATFTRTPAPTETFTATAIPPTETPNPLTPSATNTLFFPTLPAEGGQETPTPIALEPTTVPSLTPFDVLPTLITVTPFPPPTDVPAATPTLSMPTLEAQSLPGLPAGVPPLTLNVIGIDYLPIGVSACTLNANGQRVCVTGPLDANPNVVSAGRSSLGLLNFGGPLPTGITVRLLSADAVTVQSGQTVPPATSVQYALPTLPGTYFLAVEYTWENGTALYFFRLSVG